MKFSRSSDNITTLELRVLELEDSIEALTHITATIVEMLGKLNEIADHYTDTLAHLMVSIPHPSRAQITSFSPMEMFRNSLSPAFGTAGDSGSGHNGPPMPMSATRGCCGAKSEDTTHPQ
jgi:hypothetical protein